MAKSNRVESAINAKEKSDGQGENLRFPDAPYPHSMLMVFEKYDYSGFKGGFGEQLRNGGESTSTRQSGVGLRSSSSVELPFPRQLADATILNYNTMNQNPLIEGAVQKALQFGNGAGGTLGDIPGGIQDMGKALAKASAGGDVTQVIGAMAKGISETGGGDAAAISKFLLQKFIPEQLGQAVNLSVGQVLNPRETIAFEGVGLRTHTFNWDLYPSNPKDSERIREIIHRLKSVVLPSTVDIGNPESGGIARAFLAFPMVCKLYLLGINDDFYMNFKPAMVTSLTVDYGAGGTVAIMEGGRPAGVNIAMTFQELQIETSNDYTGVPSESVAGVNIAPAEAEAG
jgi:hypothetical protein|tara:strand:- start:10966 stop:11994 length:1029 start_codon:yes stop_codon:yes gene_type:complete